jgi:hypothetical protein
MRNFSYIFAVLNVIALTQFVLNFSPIAAKA